MTRDAADVQAMVSRVQLSGARLRSNIEELRAERVSPRAIGELIDLKATTVRTMMIEWGIE
jgi:hypothetical protein